MAQTLGAGPRQGLAGQEVLAGPQLLQQTLQERPEAGHALHRHQALAVLLAMEGG